MLLNLVDKHWKGEQSLHHNNFLCKTVFGFGGMLKLDNRNLKIIKELSLFLLWAPAQAVHILSMMEGDISGRQAEVRTLRREADALSFQAAAREEEHNGNLWPHCSAGDGSQHSCEWILHQRKIWSFTQFLWTVTLILTLGRLNEQLRIILQENVSLKKQLIRLEQQCLESVKGGSTRRVETRLSVLWFCHSVVA